MAHVESTKINASDKQLVAYYESSGYTIDTAPVKRPAPPAPRKRPPAAKRPPPK